MALVTPSYTVSFILREDLRNLANSSAVASIELELRRRVTLVFFHQVSQSAPSADDDGASELLNTFSHIYPVEW